MSATLYHTLKNHVRGYGFYTNPIDIRKVISITYSKRLFRIMDKDYIYRLDIEYYDPKSVLTTIHVFSSNGGPAVGISSSYEEHSYITLRYKTRTDVEQEISEIKKFDDEQNMKLQNFANEQNMKLT